MYISIPISKLNYARVCVSLIYNMVYIPQYKLYSHFYFQVMFFVIVVFFFQFVMLRKIRRRRRKTKLKASIIRE